MSASVGGSPIGMFVVLMLSLVMVWLLFLYGAITAYKGANNKISLSLLIGTLKVLVGTLLYFTAAIVVYNNYGEETRITSSLTNLSFFLLALGFLTIAISFVLYVKKHNNLLKKLGD